jgi:hypothetical protein
MSNEHGSHRHDDLDAIERLIGDVARTMTASPPRAGLARRVETRIAGEGARRRRRRFNSWGRSWVLAPAAAACVLLLAVFVARETRESRPAVRDAIGRPAPSAPDTVTQERAPLEVSEPGARGRAGVEQPTRRSPSVAASIPAAAIPPLALPPISAIERMEVPPIARGDQIDITGIAIERLEIAPMP